jgi:hypothetical protein
MSDLVQDICLPRRCRFAFLFFLLNDLFGCVGDKFFITKLGIDPLDVRIGLGELLVEPDLLGRKIDHALERQGGNLAPDQ